MRIREFIKEVMDDNSFTDAEIIKYCKGLDRELLEELVNELWMEYYSFDDVGEWQKANRMMRAYNLICERFNVDIWKEKEEPGNTKNDVVLPEELNTELAHIYWTKAKTLGFVNDDYTFNGTRYQQAYFAELFAEKLGLEDKWKPFKVLWNYNYFSQVRRESLERFGKVDRQKEIEAIFN